MLDFPASDVTSFMKGSFLRKTYVARGGINRVQATLAEGIQDVRLQTRVNKVERVDGGVSIRYESTQDERRSEEVFDRVVLAVSPNVAAAIFNPSKPLLSVIPTVPVTSTVLASPNTKISLVNEKTHVPSGECSYRRGEAQIMAFRTTYSDSIVQTESLHYLEGGLVVRTSPSGDVPEVKGTLDTSRFTRTLRTTESRNMVRKAMGTSDGVGWVNGKDDVCIVGSWCWDGMVLLEGCVVSAMRVARDLGVNVPW
jgi:phytoene dehydrogenase-like protein